MKYLEEIESFYDWLETNPISDSAIALWHALMFTSYKAGWKLEFTAANSTLESRSRLKKDAIIRARNRLQQLERIEFTPRPGNQSTVYRIIPFINSVVLSDAKRDTNRAQSAMQSDHKPPPFKDLSVQDHKTVTVTPTVDHELRIVEPMTMAEAHRKVFGTIMIPSMHSDFLLPILNQHGEQYAVELLLEMGEAASKPSIRYLEKVHAGWQKDRVSSRVEARAKRESEVAEWEGQKSRSAAGRGSSASRGSRKPAMPVVSSDGPARILSQEEREEMMALARKLRDG